MKKKIVTFVFVALVAVSAVAPFGTVLAASTSTDQNRVSSTSIHRRIFNLTGINYPRIADKEYNLLLKKLYQLLIEIRQLESAK